MTGQKREKATSIGALPRLRLSCGDLRRERRNRGKSDDCLGGGSWCWKYVFPIAQNPHKGKEFVELKLGGWVGVVDGQVKRRTTRCDCLRQAKVVRLHEGLAPGECPKLGDRRKQNPKGGSSAHVMSRPIEEHVKHVITRDCTILDTLHEVDGRNRVIRVRRIPVVGGETLGGHIESV